MLRAHRDHVHHAGHRRPTRQRRRSTRPRTYSACPRCFIASSSTETIRIADRDRRVPVRVDDALVGAGVEVLHQRRRAVVDGAVVLAEESRIDDLEPADVLGAHAPAVDVGRVGQPEAVDPAVTEPRGLLAGQVRHLVVLLAGQVPDEPGDVVRVGVRPPQQLVDGEPVDDLRHPVADAAEAVEQEVPRGVRRHVVHHPACT